MNSSRPSLTHGCSAAARCQFDAVRHVRLNLVLFDLDLGLVLPRLPQQPFYVVLCVLGHTTELRKIRIVLGYIRKLVASLRPVQNRLSQSGCSLERPLLWASASAIILADGMRFLSVRARMPSQIFWNSASTFATYSFSASDVSCRLGFLLSLDHLLDLNLHLMFSFFGFLRCNRPDCFSDL